MNPPLVSTEPSSRWAPYVATESEPWDVRRVVHLHRRAGFAANWTRIQRDIADGAVAAVDRLLQGRAIADESNEFQSLARTIGDAATASGNSSRLKAWWLYRMLLSPDPLGERLTLMWHNHFATSNRKVQNLVLMREQNELLRKHALAPFGELLDAIVKHPSMLVWLDADSNRSGHPNENLARELMELFTLGIGNYSEDDIKEAARALTGWTVVAGRFGVRPERHDDRTKTILGRQAAMNGDDLIQRLLVHPATAHRIAWRICHTLMGENVVDAPSLAELAEGLKSRDLDVQWAVGTVLRSKRFFAAENLGSRVLGPAEYIIGSLRALELTAPPASTLILAEWAARMGQDLFYPPNVGGWNEGRAWLSSRMVIARANFADALASGQLWHPTAQPDMGKLVHRSIGAVSIEDGAVWLAKLLWGDSPIDAVQAAARAAANKSSQSMSTVAAQLLARPEHHAA